MSTSTRPDHLERLRLALLELQACMVAMGPHVRVESIRIAGTRDAAGRLTGLARHELEVALIASESYLANAPLLVERHTRKLPPHVVCEVVGVRVTEHVRTR